MPSDAHCHPYYLNKVFADAEAQRKAFNVRCAASAFSKDEFLYNEALSKKTDSPRMALCFGAHPQLCAKHKDAPAEEHSKPLAADLSAADFLETLAGEKRISSAGEIGFDLFNKFYKESEPLQRRVFEYQIDIALKYSLPAVLHIRRAMHKVFVYRKELRGLPAVVFHSFSGSPEEALSILRCGINAYFSFGTPVLCRHKKAIRCVKELPLDRILFETDAPYQNLKGEEYSSYKTLYAVILFAAKLRGKDEQELISISDNNFNSIFGGQNE